MIHSRCIEEYYAWEKKKKVHVFSEKFDNEFVETPKGDPEG